MLSILVLNFNKPMKLLSLCSNPLFSSIIAFYTLILIYAPCFFIGIALSPVFNSTAIILLFLIRLGANERSIKQSSFQELDIHDSSANEKLEKESDYLEPRTRAHKDYDYEGVQNDGSNLTSYTCLNQESSSLEPKVLDRVHENQTHAGFETTKIDLGPESNHSHVVVEHELGSVSNFQDYHYKWELLDANSTESSQVVKEGETRMEMNPKQIDTTMKILEWNMKAPLEIIYEAYEGEEEDEEGNVNNLVSNDKETVSCERYPSLLMYYSESEIDSSSDGDFPMNENWETHESAFFRWEEEEDDREELIEISLDRYGKRSIEFSHNDEENLIEIDISPSDV